MIPDEVFVHIVCHDCNSFAVCDHAFKPGRDHALRIVCHSRSPSRRDAICEACGGRGRSCPATSGPAWRAECLPTTVDPRTYECWTPKDGAEAPGAPLDFTPKYQCRLKGGA